MADLREVIFSSDGSGQLCTSCVWDPHTGTSLMIYKGGGGASANTLNLIAGDYISSVELAKPLMHVWPLNSQQPAQGLRLVLPGRSNAVAFSPDGKFCVAAFDEKIYVWQVDTGNLQAILARHYQTVTNLRFCDDGSHFVSAAEDGVVMIWSLATVCSHRDLDILSQSIAGQHDPLHILTDHSLPVTGIAVGKDGLRGRLITVSTDRSCRIYSTSTAELLLNVVFDNSLTCVTTDALEVNVFVGTADGAIRQFDVKKPPRERDVYPDAATFTGHTKKVTCLSTSADGVTLLSGSLDENIFLWHVPSRRKIRTIQQRGPVFNAFFAPAPASLFADKFSPTVAIVNFQRSQDNCNADIEILSDGCNGFWTGEELHSQEVAQSDCAATDNSKVETLKSEVERLRRVNSELYTYAARKIVASVVHVAAPKNKRKKIKNRLNHT